MFSHSSGTAAIVEQTRRSYPGRVEMGEDLMVIDIGAACETSCGWGTAAIADWHVAPMLARDEPRQHRDARALVSVSDDVASHDLLLITHPEVRRDPKVRATADFLKQLAAEPPGLC